MITTKYLGPTNTRGPRVKATCHGSTLTVPWDHALDAGPNHDRAARDLAERLGIAGPVFRTSTATGYVYTTDRRPAFTIGDATGDAAELLARVRRFYAICERDGSTDTGVAWELLLDIDSHLASVTGER